MHDLNTRNQAREIIRAAEQILEATAHLADIVPVSDEEDALDMRANSRSARSAKMSCEDAADKVRKGTHLAHPYRLAQTAINRASGYCERIVRDAVSNLEERQ